MTPSGSARSAARMWSGSTTWWLCSAASRWAPARASRDLSVSLFGSILAPLDRSGLPPRQPELAHGDQVAASLLLEHPGHLAATVPLALQGLQHLLELAPGLIDLLLELHDQLDPGQVDPRLGQLLDGAQPVDVPLRVPPSVPGGPGRPEQSLALVDPQGLGMDPRELGGHADDVDGPVLASLLVLVRHLSSLPRRSPGGCGDSPRRPPGAASGAAVPAWTGGTAPPPR